MLLCLAGASALAPAAPDVLSWVCAHGGGSAVRAGLDGDGVRGLLAARDAQVGDVLLEVPLALAIADCGDGADGAEPLAGEPPAWCHALPSSGRNGRDAARLAAFAAAAAHAAPPHTPRDRSDERLHHHGAANDANAEGLRLSAASVTRASRKADGRGAEDFTEAPPPREESEALPRRAPSATHHAARAAGSDRAP